MTNMTAVGRAAVEQALEMMLSRRANRATLIPKDVGVVQRGMEVLRPVMFLRQEGDEQFHPLNQLELALLEKVVEEYKSSGKLRIVGEGNNNPLAEEYVKIRYNYITRHLKGGRVITPREFRASTCIIAESLMRVAKEECGGITPETVVLLPWRAAILGAKPAYEAGARLFCHLGAHRVRHAETEVYFTKKPKPLRRNAAGQRALIFDPAFATGKTIITSIKLLTDFGIAEKNIVITAVISAPEGIDHVLSRFPEVRVIVGNNDECLDSHAYIDPGFGDAGDMSCEELLQDTALTGWWLEKNVFGDTATYREFLSHMG